MTASASETGELVRISAANPQQDQQSLELDGDNPVFQPLRRSTRNIRRAVP